jgi:hypothetical protein
LTTPIIRADEVDLTESAEKGTDKIVREARKRVSKTATRNAALKAAGDRERQAIRDEQRQMREDARRRRIARAAKEAM